MSSTGLWMLGVLAMAIIATRLPVWALLIGVASAFAGIGLMRGVFDTGILAAVVPRVLNLLEHDLLQAMPSMSLSGCCCNGCPWPMRCSQQQCACSARSAPPRRSARLRSAP
jgi:TRAP-type mannitol/chloroaromatic compound transport system permease large subunit